MLETLRWNGLAVVMIDQTRLPLEVVEVEINSPEQMWDAIRRLVVRGAPAIGIAAAFGVYLGVRAAAGGDYLAKLEQVCAYLATSRPTAVNLFWAIERLRRLGRSLLHQSAADLQAAKERLLQECLLMIEEDNRICRAIGEAGADLILRRPAAADGRRHLLTHCNAGGLATAQFGTALAPIYALKERGEAVHVFVDETRPLLQGARITALELMQNGVDCTLICDNMAASVLRRHAVAAVIVGTDRVAASGDVANKVGTFPLAIVARHLGVPFYVAAPLSSIDMSLASGDQIPIEQRSAEEITEGFGRRTAPPGVACFNPAFDVTPAELVSAIITERGVIVPPYRPALAALPGEQG
jgi:methylthioribose-1-phosphate isomerase